MQGTPDPLASLEPDGTSEPGCEPEPLSPLADPEPEGWEPESEADTDTEPESDPDGPDESDADAEPDPDAEADPESEPDTDADTDTEPESDLEADPESDHEPESDLEAETDTEPESELGCDLESDADIEPESLADTLAEPDEPLGPEAEEWESDHDRDPESDAEPDCDPDEALWSLDPLDPDAEAELEDGPLLDIDSDPLIESLPDEPDCEPLDPLDPLDPLEPDEEPESDDEDQDPDDSLTEENDLLDPQVDSAVVHRLFIGVGTPNEPLIRLELPAGTGREAVAAEALADARQAEDKPHGFVRPLLRKLHVDLAPVDGRADQHRTIGHAPADLDAVRLAYLQKPLVDRQFGVFLGNGRLENIVEPDFRRFQYKERGIAALGPTGRHNSG